MVDYKLNDVVRCSCGQFHKIIEISKNLMSVDFIVYKFHNRCPTFGKWISNYGWTVNEQPKIASRLEVLFYA